MNRSKRFWNSLDDALASKPSKKLAVPSTIEVRLKNDCI